MPPKTVKTYLERYVVKFCERFQENNYRRNNRKNRSVFKTIRDPLGIGRKKTKSRVRETNREVFKCDSFSTKRLFTHVGRANSKITSFYWAKLIEFYARTSIWIQNSKPKYLVFYAYFLFFFCIPILYPFFQNETSISDGSYLFLSPYRYGRNESWSSLHQAIQFSIDVLQLYHHYWLKPFGVGLNFIWIKYLLKPVTVPHTCNCGAQIKPNNISQHYFSLFQSKARVFSTFSILESK